MLSEATRKALEESKIIEEKNTSKCYSSGASFIEDISHGFYRTSIKDSQDIGG